MNDGLDPVTIWSELPGSTINDDAQEIDQAVYEPLAPGCIRLLQVRPIAAWQSCMDASCDVYKDSEADMKPRQAARQLLLKSRHGVLRPSRENRSVASAVTCTLSTHSLDIAPDYTALSYAWGRPPAEYGIILNGREVVARKNLWRFLSEVSKTPDRWGYLWIDALCINQADNDERSQQVKLMARIYRQATSMCIWLGPAFAGSNEAMQHIRRFEKKSRTASDAVQTLCKQTTSLAFVALCSRAYWTRLWVYQEVSLARVKFILCGTRTVSWQGFTHAVLHSTEAVLDAEVRQPLITLTPAFDVQRLYDVEPARQSIFNLMLTTRKMLCVQPKDKIFALLGIVEQPGTQISPDYELPIVMLVNQVFTEHLRRFPVTSLADVAERCSELERMSGLPPGSIFELYTPTGERASADHQPLIMGEGLNRLDLTWADHYGHTDIARMLLMERRLAPDCEQAIIAHHDTVDLQPLLLYGTGPTGAPVNDWLLPFIARLGRVEMMKELFAGWTRLHHPAYAPVCLAAFRCASEVGHTSVMKLLLETTPHLHEDADTYETLLSLRAQAYSRGDMQTAEVVRDLMDIPAASRC